MDTQTLSRRVESFASNLVAGFVGGTTVAIYTEAITLSTVLDNVRAFELDRRLLETTALVVGLLLVAFALVAVFAVLSGRRAQSRHEPADEGVIVRSGGVNVADVSWRATVAESADLRLTVHEGERDPVVKLDVERDGRG